MVGLGETDEEILQAMELCAEAGVDLITLGQYLAPSKKHLAVDRFPEPELYHNGAKQQSTWDSWSGERPTGEIIIQGRLSL